MLLLGSEVLVAATSPAVASADEGACVPRSAAGGTRCAVKSAELLLSVITLWAERKTAGRPSSGGCSS